MIIIKDLSLSLGDKTLFAAINWTIPPGSRIGLVGNNGTGKTTLLRAIMGDLELDRGVVNIPDRRNKNIGYLPQDLVELGEDPLLHFLKKQSGILALEETIKASGEQIARREEGDSGQAQAQDEYERALAVYNARDGYAFEARAKQILAGLGFNDDDFVKSCQEFSGGWKMRIFLAALLISQPDILLLDEPTNHLDAPSMEWLEEYLADYRGTIIVVSHDRWFLDKMVSQIAELASGRFALFSGNYSRYLEEKEERDEIIKKEIANQQAEIARHEAFIERFRYKATKARQAQSRLKMLEKLPVLQEERHEKKVAMRFFAPPKTGREVIKAVELGKKYGDKIVFSKVNFTVLRGQKVALVGINGAGKSTLTRLISQTEEPTWGRVEWGQNVRLSFFSQETSENLNYQQNVWEEILATTSRMNDQEKRKLLGSFLFSGDDIFKPVSVLSGGEKSRLALLKILLGDTNVLILDEPTNHLDMKTKEIFQEALLGYQGTVIVVSHDRYFLDRLVGRVMEVSGGALYDYPGNYSYFTEKRKELTKAAPAAASSPAKAKTSLPQEKKTLSDKRTEAQERNRLYQLKTALRKQLAALEAEIFRLEELKAQNESLLCNPDTLRNSARVRQLNRELTSITGELTRMYASWDDLGERLAQLTATKNPVDMAWINP